MALKTLSLAGSFSSMWRFVLRPFQDPAL